MDTDNPAQQTDLRSGPGEPDGGPSASANPLERSDVAASLARMEKSLDLIAEHLHMTRREEQVREFSLSHLLGALSLVVSVTCLVAALLALLRARTDFYWSTIALLGAIATQSLAQTLFTLSRRK